MLVIDDERDILEGMSHVLERWGCLTSPVSSLAEALDVLPGAPDLIGRRLPAARSPHPASRRSRRCARPFDEPIPALLVTGETEPDRLRSADAANLEVLHKPVDPDRLKAAIDRQLQARRAASAVLATTVPRDALRDSPSDAP